MIKRNILFFILIQIFVLLNFQNCSLNYNAKIFSTESQNGIYDPKHNESGNGTGYGGKLSATYAHYVPEFQCEGQNYPYSTINMLGTLSDFILNLNQNFIEKCNATNLTLLRNDVDISPWQTQVIGYKDRIYEHIEEANSNNQPLPKIPSRLIEIWCVDNWTQTKLEVLSSYDITAQVALSEMITVNSANLMTKLNLTNVSRLLQQNSVTLQTIEGVLTVHRDQLGGKPGTYKGSWLNSQQQLANLECRLGGYLDARVWPAKVIPSSDVKQMQKSTERNSLIALTQLGTILEYQNLNLTLQTLINLGSLSHPIGSFKLSQNSQFLLFSANMKTDLSKQLYNFNLTTMKSVLLNEQLVKSNQSIEEDYQLTDNDTYVYYRDGAQEPQSTDVEKWIRRVLIDGSSPPEVIAQHEIETSDYGDMYFWIHSDSLNKTIYTLGMDETEAWLVNNNTKSEKKLSLTFTNTPNDCHLALPFNAKDNGDVLEVMDRFAVILFHCQSAFGFSSYSNSFLVVYDMLTEQFVFADKLDGYALEPTSINTLFKVNKPPVTITNTISSNLPVSAYFDITQMKFLYTTDLNFQSAKKVFQIGNRLAFLSSDLLLLTELNTTEALCSLDGETPVIDAFQIENTSEIVFYRFKSSNLIFYTYNLQDQKCRVLQKLPANSLSTDKPITLSVEKSLDYPIPIYLIRLSSETFSFYGIPKVDKHPDHLYLISSDSNKAPIDILSPVNHDSFTIRNFGFIKAQNKTIDIFYLSNSIDLNTYQNAIWRIPEGF